jgi:hypothetical protein
MRVVIDALTRCEIQKSTAKKSHACVWATDDHVGIGKEIYYLSGDGLLMPAMKDQPPPDLRYFKKYDW